MINIPPNPNIQPIESSAGTPVSVETTAAPAAAKIIPIMIPAIDGSKFPIWWSS